MSPQVLLVTASTPPVDDTESPRIAAALGGMGVRAAVASWTDPSVDWASADAVVIRSTWDYTDHVGAFLDWADAVDGVTALWNPASVLRWNAHKGYLVELAGAGVPVVPTAVVPRGADRSTIDDACEASGPGPIVVKPAVDAGARGAQRADATDPAIRAHAAALATTGDVLVQPYLPAIESDGERSVVLLWGEPLLARRKLPAPADFRVQEHHGGSTVVAELAGELIDVAHAALGVLRSPPMYARVDVVRHEGALHLMELELIEPFLYLDTDDEVRRTAEAIIRVVR